MPRGFSRVPGGTFWTMVWTNTPFASYSLMIPPPAPGVSGRRTLSMYQWSVPGTRTIAAGVNSPGVGNTVLVGGVVTRRLGLAQAGALVGKRGDYFHILT